MIEPAIIDHVERLLAEGVHSQRKIARMTGISRGTVGAIAAGRRPDYAARRTERADADEAPFRGPARRCPGCGRLVLLPCLACRIERDKAAGRTPRRDPRPDEGRPDLDLRPDDRARYEEMRGGHALPEEPEEDEGVRG